MITLAADDLPSSNGAMIGGIVGGVLALIVIVAIIVGIVVWRKRSNRDKNNGVSPYDAVEVVKQPTRSNEYGTLGMDQILYTRSPIGFDD
jgi:uncharacterized membrane protein